MGPPTSPPGLPLDILSFGENVLFFVLVDIFLLISSGQMLFCLIYTPTS